MNEELRDIFHRILKERGQTIPGVGLYHYAMLDALGEMVDRLVERKVPKKKWADDGA